MAITIDDLEAAGIDPRTILAAVKASESREARSASEAETARRKAERDRKRAWRASDKSAGQAGNDGTSRDIADGTEPLAGPSVGETQSVVPDEGSAKRTADEENSQKENPPHPLKKNSSCFLPSFNLESEKERSGVTRARADPHFDEFWVAYPHKVGKSDAARAFPKALKQVDIVTLMAALAAYAAKTDDRPWCNPATWLNGGRWTDQPAKVNGNEQHRKFGSRGHSAGPSLSGLAFEYASDPD